MNKKVERTGGRENTHCLRQGGYIFTYVYLFACLFVCLLTDYVRTTERILTKLYLQIALRCPKNPQLQFMGRSHTSKSYEWIFMKFSGNVQKVSRNK